MSSPFLYRLRVLSSKRGHGRTENIIPVYAIKADVAQGSAWYTGEMNLNVLRMIALGADGARVLTVCTDVPYAYRAIEDKDVEFFELSVKDTRIRTAPTEERRTVATITCKDMNGGKRIPIDRSQIKMSCEPLSNLLVTVSLDFHDYDGGPVFTQF